MGRHRLSAGANHSDADLRQARRSLWAKDRATVGDRAASDRLGALRTEPEHDPADSLSRYSRVGRRRANCYHTSGSRRHCPAPRSRTLSGNLRGCLRTLEHRWSIAWRLLHHAPVVALDFLHQFARWYRRAGGVGCDASIPLASRGSRHRLCGRCAACGRAQQHHSSL